MVGTDAVARAARRRRLPLSARARGPRDTALAAQIEAAAAAGALGRTVRTAIRAGLPVAVAASALLRRALTVHRVARRHCLVFGVSASLPRDASLTSEVELPAATPALRVRVHIARRAALTSAVRTGALLRRALAVYRVARRHSLILRIGARGPGVAALDIEVVAAAAARAFVIVVAVAGTPGYRLPEGVKPGMEATEMLVIEEETFASGSAVVEVEVDPETGKVDIVNYVMAQDSGRILDREIAEGQLYGGIAHGIGNALFEWMRYDDDAQPISATFAEYLLVTAPEVPTAELILHETPTPRNPLGVKGIGETGLMPTTSAVISAIEDALSPFGVHLTRVPLTPPDILAAIAESTG